MAGVNKVILVGRLGADPEVRYTPNGTAVANFRIATTERWTNKEGKREERTEWHRIVAYSKLGEICGQYLAKGKQVYIEGRIQTRNWEDKDGNKRWTTEIVANTMQMLGPPSPESQQEPGTGNREPGKGQSLEEAPLPQDIRSEDDIPF